MKEYRLISDNNKVTLSRLEEIVKTIPQKLRLFSPGDFSKKPDPDKWSPKQILGHLIDSATNNHHRFVRAQFEDRPAVQYQQNQWVDYSYYQGMEGAHLIAFWELYNRHLIELMRRIPQEVLSKECDLGDGEYRSIAWVFDDYVRHMEHHLKQIFERVRE